MGQRKLETFLGGRLTVSMLCLVSTLLMWLKIGAIEGKKSTDRFFLGVLPARWIENMILSL